MKKNPTTLFICIYGPNLKKIGLVISEKLNSSPQQEEEEEQQQLQSYDCSPL